MPDHAHFVVAQTDRDLDQTILQFKAAATRQLLAEGIHPFQGQSPVPKCFAQGGWKVFLKAEAVDQTIRYVEDNPIKAGLPPQKWWFVSRETSVERGGAMDNPKT
jgi:REP element-mobilizing transposase RayT